MLITKEIGIDMGHRVPNHKSKCKNLHGHRYKIEVGVDDKVITESGRADEGMVIDFGDLKEIMMVVLDGQFDHGFCMYEKDILADKLKEMKYVSEKIIFVPFIPTAENLAKHWFELLDVALKARNISIKHIKVWETPTSTAIYSIQDKSMTQKEIEEICQCSGAPK